MKSMKELKKIYTGIQHQLSNLIPEKWDSIYLYASIKKQFNNIETWEMYFYYIPAGFIRKNPINVYEVPSKFNVDESEYLILVDNLCNSIKKLYRVYKDTYQKEWTNMVISIKDEQFLIEYNDENLIRSRFTNQDRHIIFKHKYLNIPIQNFSKKDRNVILDYLNNEEYKQVFDRYFEYIPKKQVNNYIEYEKENQDIEDLYATNLVEFKEKKPNFFKIILNKLRKKSNEEILKEI